MIQLQQNRLYNFIPVEYQEMVEEEVMYSYRLFSDEHSLPCLDETVVERLSFYYMAIRHYYDTGEVIDGKWMAEEGNWEHLTNTYPLERFNDDYLDLRSDIKRFMDMYSLVYEDNWLFSKVTKDYTNQQCNLPIQEVW